MEDVLDVYQRPYDARYPVICLDETGKELRSTLPGREDLPIQVGKPKAKSVRQDYGYKHEGSANLLMVCEPLRGWRMVETMPDRTGRSFARMLKQLVDEVYPDAEKLVLVTDNLNIHNPAYLYDVFPPEEARRLAKKIEWHYTPEHGSWLNMAELELSVLSRQCLKGRFANVEVLRCQVDAWTQERNRRAVKINWQFTTQDARIRLRRLYPVIVDIS